MEDLGFRSRFFFLEKIVLVAEWSGTPPYKGCFIYRRTRQGPLVGCHYLLLHPAMLDLSMRNALPVL